MDRTTQPPIHILDELRIQQPERSVLPNGVPLAVIRAGEQEVTRIDILFGAGRWYQTQNLQALFTNRMLREGTRSYTAAHIASRLDYYGSWLELSTSPEYAYITVYSLNKYLPETLEIVESMVKAPTFPEKELRSVLDTNIQQYLVNTSKVDFLAHRGLLKVLYGDNHPCGRLVGEEDYRAIHPRALADFHRRYYHSGNCSVFLSGRVTDECVRRIADIFGVPFGAVGERPVLPVYIPQTDAEKRIFINRADATQSAVKLGCLTIPREHPDYPKLRVLLTLFGGYFGSRLMSNIREEKGYTYGINSGIIFYPGNGMLAISAEADNRYVEPLVAEIYHEIDRLHTELVSEEELATVRNYMLGDMCRSYESPFSLADAWIFIDASGLPRDFFTRSLQAATQITAVEIQQLAQQYLCKEKLKEVIAGKKMD